MAQVTIPITSDAGKLISDLRQISSEYKNLSTAGKQAMQNVDGAVDNLSESLHKASNNVDRLEKEIKQMEDAKKGMAPGKELNDLNQKLNEANASLKRQIDLYEKLSKESKETTEQQKKDGEKVVKQNKKTEESFSNLKTAFVAAFSTVVIKNFIASSVEAYRIQKDAENQLLVALNGRSDIQRDLIREAGELQSKTIVGDETIIQQQKYLASIGFTKDQISEVIKASLDLSAATGTSLDSAVKNLAKTYGGLVGELGESIPQLRNLTQEQLKNGEAVKFAAEQFKGLAEEQAKGAGQLKQAENNIGDFKEAVGGLFIGLLDAIGGLEEFNNQLSKTNQFLSNESIPAGVRFGNLISNNTFAMQTIGEATAKYQEILDDNITSLVDYQKKVQQNITVTNEETAAYNRLAGGTDVVSKEVDRLAKALAAEELAQIASAEAAKRNTGAKKEQLTAYELLNKEIGELEKRLQNEVLENDNAAIATAKHLDELKNQKKQVDETVESLQQYKDITEAVSLGQQSAAKSLDESLEMEEMKLITTNQAREEYLAKLEEDADFKKQERQAYIDLGIVAIETYQKISEAQAKQAQERTALLNTRIAEAQRELQLEIQLNERGVASNIQLRQAELAELKKQREESLKDQEAAAKKQKAISIALQAAQLVTSVTNIIAQATASGGPVGLLVAAAALPSLYALYETAKAKTNELTKFESGGVGIFGGKLHSQGGNKLYSEGIETEKGEMYGILSRKNTAKYGTAFEAITNGINTNNSNELLAGIMQLTALKGMGLNYDMLTKASDIKLNNNIRFDDDGYLKKINDNLSSRGWIMVSDNIMRKGNMTRKIRN